MPNRRQLLRSAGAITLGAMTTIASPHLLLARDLKKIRIALGWIPDVQYAGMWIAMSEGYFADEGIEIEYIPGGPNTAGPVVTVASGRADIGLAAWLPLIDAVQKGNDFVLFAYTFPKSPLGLISLASDPILKPGDIVGAKILNQDLNGRTAIDAVLKLNQLPTTWQEVPAGFSPEPLLSKQGKGYVAYETTQVITLEQMGMTRGKDFHFLSFYDVGFTVFAGGMFTTRAFLGQNRETLVGLCRALRKGWQKNEEDPALAARLVTEKYARDFGMKADQQAKTNAVQISLMRSTGGFGIDPVQFSGSMYQAASAAGRNEIPPPEKIADFSIIKDALK